MRFMYVDESGDPGPLNPFIPEHANPSRHYVLSGLVVSAEEWRNYLVAIVDIRREVRLAYGLPISTEWHGAEIIHPRTPGPLRTLGRRRRIDLYGFLLSQVVSRLPSARLIHVCADKLKHNPPWPPEKLQAEAWMRLLQRYDNFLRWSCDKDLGMVISDDTNEHAVRGVLRRMRHVSYLASHYGGGYAAPLNNVIEDPVFRVSHQSYFVQIADLAAHALYRFRFKKGSLRKHNVDRLFRVLEPLLVKKASSSDPDGLGIVSV